MLLQSDPFRKSKKGDYTFEGTVGGVHVEFGITSAGGGSYAFHVEAVGVDLVGAANPVTVELVIVNNGGTTQTSIETD